MGCPKRIVEKRFLFWKRKIELPHDWKPDFISRYIDMYKIIYQCKYCECTTYKWVDDEGLIRLFGFLPTVRYIINMNDIEKQREKNK